jgi:hypothetical protein
MGPNIWLSSSSGLLCALAWGNLLPALTAQSSGSANIDTENVATGYVAQTGTYTDDNHVGYNIYRLYIRLNASSNAQGVYAIYGNDVNPLDLPGARQDPAFSVNIGGMDAIHTTVFPQTAYDSWLTVGIDSGNNNGALSSSGIIFDTWSEDRRLQVNDINGGSVFWMNVADAPTRADNDGQGVVGDNMDGTSLDFLVAQLTIPASVNSWSGTMAAQGHEIGPALGQPGSTSWQEPRIEFCWHPAAGHDCAAIGAVPTPAPPAPIPPSPGPVTCGPGQGPGSGGGGCHPCLGSTWSDTGSHCQSCAPGSSTTDPHVTPPHSACTPCPAHQYSSDGAQCRMCPPGHEANPSQTGCVPMAHPPNNVQIEVDDATVEAFVTQVSTGAIADADTPHTYTTYRLKLGAVAGSDAYNLYTIFADSQNGVEHRMVFPPAYQSTAPVATDVGGINPQDFSQYDTASRDSWLTVGITDGSTPTGWSSTYNHVGIIFDNWNERSLLEVADGAVTWMDPRQCDDFLGGNQIVVAQLTLDDAAGRQSAVINAQGRTMVGAHQNQVANILEGHDWQQRAIHFYMGAGPAPPPAPGPPTLTYLAQGESCHPGSNTRVCDTRVSPPLSCYLPPEYQGTLDAPHFCVTTVPRGSDCSHYTLTMCEGGSDCDEGGSCSGASAPSSPPPSSPSMTYLNRGDACDPTSVAQVCDPRQSPGSPPLFCRSPGNAGTINAQHYCVRIAPSGANCSDGLSTRCIGGTLCINSVCSAADPCVTGSQYRDYAARVTHVCCDEPTEDCSSGEPSACNAGCAAVLLPMAAACDNYLAGFASRAVERQSLASAARLCPSHSTVTPGGGH